MPEQLYNPESQMIEHIERQELAARDARRRLLAAKSESDRRVLERQLKELETEIENLRKRLP